MSSDAAELKKHIKQLQNTTSEGEIHDKLVFLKREFTVTESVLRESKAGLAVGKLRSHPSKLISDTAKDLVKKWKGEVQRATNAAGGSKPSAKAPAKKTSVTPTATTPKVQTRSAKLDGIVCSKTGDKTRDKCLELLYDSLAADTDAAKETILALAEGIEAAVYTQCGGASGEYKNKIRTLFTNIKDKKNPRLRAHIISGELSVERLSKMSSAEMASEERKIEDAKINEANLFASLGAGEPEAETDAFMCSRCKERKCSYRQAQTRSADEPMTTFVTCLNCGNRWKFS